jgi:tetratricopeptide (TPR) repeat protein
MMLRALLIFVLTTGHAAAHGLLHDQVADLTRAIGRDPRNAALHLKRAELHRQHRDWGAAAADLDAVRRLDPDAVDVELAGSRLAADRGLLAESEAALSRYLALRPESEVALAMRADLRDRMGLNPEAAADYAAAIRIANEPSVEYVVGLAQALARAGDDNAALAAVDAGQARLGPLVVLEQWAVENLVRTRRWDEALARQERLLARSPRKETGLTRRAEILALAGRRDDAHAAFEAAGAQWELLPERIRVTRAMIDLHRRIAVGAAETMGTVNRKQATSTVPSH